MSNALTIKKAGYKTKRLETQKYKGVFGGTCNHVIALVNQNNEVLHYEGKPYYPAGRLHTYACLIKSGDINAACFSFKKIEIKNRQL